MIDAKAFYDALLELKLDFFTGVPDSLLQSFCACLEAHAGDAAVTAANEGNAIGIASGYHLATGKCAVVYLQNSGLGNAVNPLVSLADAAVYRIPMLLLIGWRGQPGVQDEPQHETQGRMTEALLQTLGIRTQILGEDYRTQLRDCEAYMAETGKPTALLVKKQTFAPYALPKRKAAHPMTREEALTILTESLSTEDILVTTTGKTSRELYELRERQGRGHDGDFLTVGSMGHGSSIALGISLFTDRQVYCIDGDGAFLMHLGAAAVNAVRMRENFRYVLINNGAHESVGGQPTVGFQIQPEVILRGCGFAQVFQAADADTLRTAAQQLRITPRAALVINVRQGSRPNLGRPTLSPQENKLQLMEKLSHESTDF